ncbi:rCG38181 [Rattus norvegicus]|uniref:RCG38181 n=1 Tax=Rattus norvegicus TaxID=10116 RepID=A6IV00_RAT|nr:rCG38181 [Rattus norvegicus]
MVMVFSAMHPDLYDTLMSIFLWESSQALVSPEDLHSWHPLCRQPQEGPLSYSMAPWSSGINACLVVFAIWALVLFRLFCLFSPDHWLSRCMHFYRALRLLYFLLNLI